MLLWLTTSVPAVGGVLCVGADGHLAIERSHASNDCTAETEPHVFHGPSASLLAPGRDCTDTPLPGGLIASLRAEQKQSGDTHAAPLLLTVLPAWEPQSSRITHPHASAGGAHSVHAALIRSTVLLI